MTAQKLKRYWLWAVVLLSSGPILAGCQSKPRAPLETAMWFWHTPFDIPAKAQKDLDAIGVKEIFVRAATFSNDGEQMVAVLPQSWPQKGAGRLHLVFNYDGGAVRHFEEFENSAVADAVADAYGRHRAAAERQGYAVVGCQLDLDVPTRLLPKYGGLLHEVRARLPKGTKLSITGLTTWLGSGDLPKVLKELDFWTPQFYEATMPATVDADAPVSTLASLDRGLRRCGELGTPFYAGLATYGQSLIYDPSGKLLGTYRGLSVYDAARHPSLELVKADIRKGEANYLFKAVRPARDGKGLGDQLLYRLSTPESLAAAVKEVREKAPANCKGMILFRVSEEGESTAMALTTIRATLAGETPTPSLRLSMESKKRPFGVIEGRSSDLSRDVQIRVVNEGTEGTVVGPGAVTLILRFAQGALEEVAPGSFDQVSPFVGDESTIGRVSARRADGLVLSRVHLGAGEAISTGRIVLSDRSKLTGEWRLRTLDGRVLSGKLKNSP